MKRTALTKKDSEILTENLFVLSDYYLDDNQVLLLKLASSCYQNTLTMEVAQEAVHLLSKLRTSMLCVEIVTINTQKILSAFEETMQLFNKYAQPNL